MDATLWKALFALLPASLLLAGALAFFFKERSPSSLLQLLGAGGLVVVILAHVCEGVHLFPGMGWGLKHSAGHYLDLCAAIVALTLFPVGYLLHAFGKNHASGCR